MKPSAVRYYEERGLIAPEERRGGKRVYSEKAIERLILIAYAKELGFSLDEVRELLDGFSDKRWSKLASKKLEALDTMAQRIEMMKGALHKISGCTCSDVDACARAIASKRCAP